MSKIFIRMDSKKPRHGRTTCSPCSPGEYGGWSGEEYPLKGSIAKDNAHYVGDHIYEYVGTIRAVSVGTKKVAQPFVAGKVYSERARYNNGKARKCIGTFNGEVIWESPNKAVWARTKLDGSPVSFGGVSMVPDFVEEDLGIEYKLVKE